MQPDRALNDAELDRELERAFAVDPSPEFVARVRTRIAGESPRSWMWNRAWSFAGGPIIAIVLIVIAMQLSNRREVPSATASLLAARTVAPVTGGLIDRTPGRVTLRRPRATEPGRIAVAPSSLVTARPERHGVDTIAATTNSGLPEVLIDPREAAALRALIAGVRTGRIDLSPALRASTPTVMALPPVEDIDIPLLTIEPLAPIGAEGVRQ